MSSAPSGELYPRYCFELAPTFNVWCLLRAVDIHDLKEHDAGFQGEKFYFHVNLPIKWVRIVGVVVAIDEIAGRRFYTVDDSSGACIEAVVPMPPAASSKPVDKINVSNQTLAQPDQLASDRAPPPTTSQTPEIDVGAVVDVKGRLDSFRDEKQIQVEKIRRLRSTAEEVALWEKRAAFERNVLSQPWVLRRRDIRKCHKEAQASEAKMERKRRRLEAVTGGGGTSREPAPKAEITASRPTAADLRAIIKGSAGLGTYNALGL